jgi:hypothetical protein
MLGTVTFGSLAQRTNGADRKFQLATFSADVTIPIGHACMGGGISPAKEIVDPLYANGIILLGSGKPIVYVAVDWCEIRNDAYTAWREALANAVGTEPARVLVSAIHQHDAPVVDLEAERILLKHKAKGSVCDIAFHEKAVRRVAEAAKKSLDTAKPITHLGMGQAKVEKVGSNRRYLVDGKPRFNRMSATRDPKIREHPEGLIDPWLKTLSFWNGDQALAAISVYALHPMSYYGKGGVTADFVGMARKRRQADDPGCFQIYASGCSGNVVAGKYNDGAPENRPVLADRMYQAMVAAWKATKKVPLESIGFRAVDMRLEPRGEEFTVEALTKRLTTDPKPFGQCLAALGLSWRKRANAGHKIDVPAIDLGPAQIILLPGESYVEYQLLAQRQRPDSFVVVIGYGESATGYIPTEQHIKDGDGNLSDWCWVAPGCEKAMSDAIAAALKK